MVRVACLAGIAALALWPAGANAGFYSGNDLYDSCTVERGRPEFFEKTYECVGYVAGAVDAFNTTREANGLKSCIPSRVTVAKLQDVAVAYLRDHPAERKKSASNLVFSAIREAWPCGKGKKK